MSLTSWKETMMEWEFRLESVLKEMHLHLVFPESFEF